MTFDHPGPLKSGVPPPPTPQLPGVDHHPTAHNIWEQPPEIRYNPKKNNCF